MKVLIICNSASGLEVFRGMLIKRLIKEGNTVSSIIPVAAEQKELNAEKEIEKWNCKLIRIPMERRGMNPIKDINLIKSYYEIMKAEKPDLVITYTIKPNIYGGFVSRILKVPYAVNITGLGTAFQNNGMLKHMVTLMYKIALKKVKIVFFENSENRDVIVNYGIVPLEKTQVLAGAGVDLEHFQYRNRVIAVISLERCRVAFYKKKYKEGLKIILENNVKFKYIIRYIKYIIHRLITHESYGFNGL